MTLCGFWALLALSRYTNGTPCTSRLRIGKSLRIVSTSKDMAESLCGGGLVDPETVVSLGLELVGQRGTAGLDDAPVEEDVHEVGLDVAQDPRVVRDQQD